MPSNNYSSVRRRSLLAIITATITAGLTLAGCGSSSSTEQNNTQGQQRSVTIPFAAVAAETPLNCDAQLTGLGVSGTEARLAAAALYVHNVELLSGAGEAIPVTLDSNDWQSEGVALLDFQDRLDFCDGGPKPTNHLVKGTINHVENTQYRGVRFTLGVPQHLNHNDPAVAPAPLNNTVMFWNWQGGYKFLRWDVAPLGGVARPSDAQYSSARWNVHLGSTNCAPDPRQNAADSSTVNCEQPNRTQISLDDFRVGFDGETVSQIQIDYAALVSGSNLGLDLGGAAGCMSGITDPECGAIFARLGLSFNGQPATPQHSVFSVVNP